MTGQTGAQDVEVGNRLASFHADDVTVPTDDIWHVLAGETLSANDLMVNGVLVLDGDAVVFGTQLGSGTIKGPGTLSMRDP